MDNLRINNTPAVKIKAELIRVYGKNILMDCEGDEVWFPKDRIEIDSAESTMLIEEWLYKAIVEEGKL
jgi:hypothetical protein